MERETKKIKTGGGYELEILTYITARESREIQSVYLNEMKMNIDDAGKPNIKDINPDLANKAQDVTLGIIVKKLDNSTENILERLLDLPSTDFEEIIVEVNNLNKTEEKKTK